MKNIKYIYGLVLVFIITSCDEHDLNHYPRYSLRTVEYIPDSLKKEHQTYITETIRATNQHLSAGDYEDVEDVVYAVKRVADELFKSEVMGLEKEYDKHYWNDILIKPSDMSEYELNVLDSLINLR